MVHKTKEKRSRIKNRCSGHEAYPRDIWHFIARSTDRVGNTRTGTLLKDVLEAQTLAPEEQHQITEEIMFPKTIFPAIDLEQLRKKTSSVDPDQEAAALARARRWEHLEATPTVSRKKSDSKAVKDRRAPFNIDAVDKLITTYKQHERPAWLVPPKDKRAAAAIVDNKPRDLSKGMSKARQEEMLDQMAFAEANKKIARAQALQRKFKRTQARLKLQRVASDVSLNRMFLTSEASKSANLEDYFSQKTMDPNLSIQLIEHASPTKFHEILHRVMPLNEFKPVPYEEIVTSLTPDPEDPPPDLARSPYLTYVTPPGVKPYHHPSDGQRWGRMSAQEVFDLSARHLEDPTTAVPAGLGKTHRPIRRAAPPQVQVKTKGSVFITQADMVRSGRA